MISKEVGERLVDHVFPYAEEPKPHFDGVKMSNLVERLNSFVSHPPDTSPGLAAGALALILECRERIEEMERQNELFDDVERARDLLDGVPADGPAYEAAAILDAVLLNCAASPTAWEDGQ